MSIYLLLGFAGLCLTWGCNLQADLIDTTDPEGLQKMMPAFYADNMTNEVSKNNLYHFILLLVPVFCLINARAPSFKARLFYIYGSLMIAAAAIVPFAIQRNKKIISATGKSLPNSYHVLMTSILLVAIGFPHLDGIFGTQLWVPHFNIFYFVIFPTACLTINWICPKLPSWFDLLAFLSLAGINTVVTFALLEPFFVFLSSHNHGVTAGLLHIYSNATVNWCSASIFWDLIVVISTVCVLIWTEASYSRLIALLLTLATLICPAVTLPIHLALMTVTMKDKDIGKKNN